MAACCRWIRKTETSETQRQHIETFIQKFFIHENEHQYIRIEEIKRPLSIL